MLQGDWSSDVCSSDLKARTARLFCAGLDGDVGPVAARADTVLADLRRDAARPRLPPPEAREIGRASCRERETGQEDKTTNNKEEKRSCREETREHKRA